MGKGRSAQRRRRRQWRAEARILRAELASASHGLHPSSQHLDRDDVLYSALLGLYSEPLGRVWSECIQPFLRSEEEALAVVFGEHAVLREAKVLDLIEAPMVLERLTNDSARLREIWPLDRGDLAVLAAVWGVPIDRAA